MAEHTLTHAEYVSQLETTLKKVVDAAIGADMYERGFTYQYDNNRYTTYGDYDEVHRGNPSANKFSYPDKPYAQVDYEADVFNLWPSNIDAIFDVWKNIPGPDGFDNDEASLNRLVKQNNMTPSIKAPKALKTGFPKLPNTVFASDLNMVFNRVDDLSGAWIEAFYDNYVLPLPWVLANQHSLIAILAAGVNSEKEIWNRTQNAVLKIAEAAVTWYDSVRGVGEPSALDTMIGVAGAVYEGFTSVKDIVTHEEDDSGKKKTSVDVFGIVDAIQGLKGAGKDLIGAIKNSGVGATPPGLYVPPGQLRASCAQVTETLGQAFEYGLCRDIVHEESLLQRVLNDGVDVLTDSPGTFAMNNEKNLNVANAGRVLAPKQQMHVGTVNDVIAALEGLGHKVWDVGSQINTSGLPWLRPAGIGLGAEGPYPAFLSFENAVTGAFFETRNNLITTAGIVRTAAGYVYDVDGHGRKTLDQANAELHKYETRRDRLPAAPPPDKAEPYTVPDGTVYKDPNDCAPPDPNGIFNTGPSVGPAPVGPVRPLPGS